MERPHRLNYVLSTNRKAERALRLQLSQALVDEADVVLE